MSKPVWVLLDVVTSVQKMLLAAHGGLAGIRDQALLESALARPQQLLSYRDQASIFELASSYSYGLARNHPFVDGNKRCALTIGALFLELNGYSLDAPEAEAVLVFERLASGELSETTLSEWYRESSNAKP